MRLTEEQKTIGRRNFLKVAAGAPALVALGAAAIKQGPVPGGPVKIGLVGTGDIARGLLGQYQKEFCDLKFFECDGRRYGHIIDPRSGWPAETVISVSVVARSAAISDALATAFYVGGRRLAEDYCATNHDVLAIMLERDTEHPIVIGENRDCRVESIVH